MDIAKSNLVFPTPTKNKVAEQPNKEIIPEIDITQQQQNKQEKKNFYTLEKGLKASKKESLIPLSKNQKKNEVLTPPTTPLSKRFGNTYPFEQKSEKNNEITTTLPPSTVVATTADSSWVQKQLSENIEKMNVMKKQKLL